MAFTSSPVSIASDMTLPLPLMMTSHDFVPIPTGPPPGPCVAIEAPVPVMWSPGFTLFQNKLTTTVSHQGLPFALDGHDCGYLIPHVTNPPNNARLPMIMLFSSRKMAFAATTVRANGTAVAASTPPLLPMLCCAFPVTLPVGYVMNSLNTVRVGLTGEDVVAGALGILGTMVASYLSSGRGTPRLPDTTEVLQKALLGGSLRSWMYKSIFGIAAGVARLLITGDGTVQLQLGSKYAGFSPTFTKAVDGSYTLSASIQAATPALRKTGAVQASIKSLHKPTGKTVTTGSLSVAASPDVPNSASVTTHASSIESDRAGKHTHKTSVTTQSVETGFYTDSSSTTADTRTEKAPAVRTGYQGGRELHQSWAKPL